MAELAAKKTPRKASEKRKTLRDRLWPEIPESKLWLRSRRVGFTTLPRTMSLIARILNLLSDKGFPLSDTYLTLWCWVFDEAFLEIRNPREFAFESGFGGPRAETTWNGRMKRLEELGFILSKPGPAGDFANVLLLNPIQVINEIYKTRQHDQYYVALMSRLVQIGADDLDPEPEPSVEVAGGAVSVPFTIPPANGLAGLPPFGPLATATPTPGAPIPGSTLQLPVAAMTVQMSNLQLPASAALVPVLGNAPTDAAPIFAGGPETVASSVSVSPAAPPPSGIVWPAPNITKKEE